MNTAPNTLLILNGSPRTKGTVAKLLREIEQGARFSSYKTVFIDVASLSFALCTDCMACRTKHECVLPQNDSPERHEHAAHKATFKHNVKK